MKFGEFGILKNRLLKSKITNFTNYLKMLKIILYKTKKPKNSPHLKILIVNIRYLGVYSITRDP